MSEIRELAWKSHLSFKSCMFLLKIIIIIDMTVLEERVRYVWNANTDTVRTCYFHPQLVIQVLKFQKASQMAQQVSVFNTQV